MRITKESQKIHKGKKEKKDFFLEESTSGFVDFFFHFIHIFISFICPILIILAFCLLAFSCCIFYFPEVGG